MLKYLARRAGRAARLATGIAVTTRFGLADPFVTDCTLPPF
jgi:hypothetical protein